MKYVHKCHSAMVTSLSTYTIDTPTLTPTPPPPSKTPSYTAATIALENDVAFGLTSGTSVA